MQVYVWGKFYWSEILDQSFMYDYKNSFEAGISPPPFLHFPCSCCPFPGPMALFLFHLVNPILCPFCPLNLSFSGKNEAFCYEMFYLSFLPVDFTDTFYPPCPHMS